MEVAGDATVVLGSNPVVELELEVLELHPAKAMPTIPIAAIRLISIFPPSANEALATGRHLSTPVDVRAVLPQGAGPNLAICSVLSWGRTEVPPMRLTQWHSFGSRRKWGSMSDVSQGPGWWLASDGKWYAPELAATQPQAPPPVAVSSNPSQIPLTNSSTTPQGSITISAAQVPSFVAIGAGILVALGSLLSWASVSAGIINVSVAGTNGDGKVTLVFGILAVIAVIVFIKIPKVLWVAGAGVAFLVALGVSIYDMIHISSTSVGNSVIQANVSIGIGLWLCLIASILGVAASVYIFVNQRKASLA